jgi:hypothetical protein
LHVGRFCGTLKLVRRTHMGNPGKALFEEIVSYKRFVRDS